MCPCTLRNATTYDVAGKSEGSLSIRYAGVFGFMSLFCRPMKSGGRLLVALGPCLHLSILVRRLLTAARSATLPYLVRGVVCTFFIWNVPSDETIRFLILKENPVDAKINTLESEGKCSPSHGKSTKRVSQFDLKLTREKTKSNLRAYRLGFRISLR